MEKRSSRRHPPAKQTESEGALSNDGYKSSNFYRAMDKRASLRVGGHLPPGGNRRRLVHPRIPESSGRSGGDRERPRPGCRECGRGRPNSNSGADAKNGRHASWTIAREAQGRPDQRRTSEKHREHLLRPPAVPHSNRLLPARAEGAASQHGRSYRHGDRLLVHRQRRCGYSGIPEIAFLRTEQGQHVVQSGHRRVAGQDGYRQSCRHVAEVVGYESELRSQRQSSGTDGTGEKALGGKTGHAGKAVAIAAVGEIEKQLCHPERSEGSAVRRKMQIPCFARDDNL